eukprot:119575-Chlamydomonas_euryale.AAC.2
MSKVVYMPPLANPVELEAPPLQLPDVTEAAASAEPSPQKNCIRLSFNKHEADDKAGLEGAADAASKPKRRRRKTQEATAAAATGGGTGGDASAGSGTGGRPGEYPDGGGGSEETGSDDDFDYDRLWVRKEVAPARTESPVAPTATERGPLVAELVASAAAKGDAAEEVQEAAVDDGQDAAAPGGVELMRRPSDAELLEEDIEARRKRAARLAAQRAELHAVMEEERERLEAAAEEERLAAEAA